MNRDMHSRLTKQATWFAMLHSLFVFTLAFDFIQFY